MQVTGTIRTITEAQTGQSKDGKEWKKITFVVSNNDGFEGAEQIFAFEIFGAEKVDKFLQYNKEGDTVDVDFNIRTNEYQGKYYTSLQAWKVFKADGQTQAPQQADAPVIDDEDDLPF
jgi:hypothetical protein